MKSMFVDTSGWYACADLADRAHAAAQLARDAWLREGGLLLSTDYVLDETLTLLRARLGLVAAQRWWEQVQASPRVRWEWVGLERAEKARDLFFRQGDKDYSFTDCTSFVVMQQLKLKQVLATDRHFAQAGFQLLPAV